MSQIAHANGAKANGRAEQNFGEKIIDRTGVRLSEIIKRVSLSLWKRKVPNELSTRTGTSIRACEYVLAQRNGLSGEALANLLRSDEGLAFLDEMMRDDPPFWWREMKHHYERAERQRRQDYQRARVNRPR